MSVVVKMGGVDILAKLQDLEQRIEHLEKMTEAHNTALLSLLFKLVYLDLRAWLVRGTKK